MKEQRIIDRRRLILSCAMVAVFLLGDRSVGSPEEAAQRVQFADVAFQSGLRKRSISGGGEKKYIVEAKGGGGAAFLDYDGDGDMDLYAVNGSTLEGFEPGRDPTNTLYRNNGDGTFTDVSESAGVGDVGWGMGCTAADYDNDGDVDIYVTNFGPNVLYRNNGDGTFTDVTDLAGVGDERWGTGCAFGDYDNDGYLDLYVANYVDFDINYEPPSKRFCLWRGIMTFYGPKGLKGAADVLYHNNGDGTFTDVTERAGVVDKYKYYGFNATFGDYDNDGDQDIYVANDGCQNFLYRNNDDGTFTDVALIAGAGYNTDGREQGGMGATFGDYDNNGFLDIFVTNFSDDNNTLYRNDGNGFFSDITFRVGLGEESWMYVGWGTEFLDHDNDKDLDIFIANGHVYPQVETEGYDFGMTYAQKNQLFENKGDGTFKEVSGLMGPGFDVQKVSRGACLSDYDNDGDVDIFVANLDDTPTLLRNDGGNKNNWLVVKTIGTKSNRDGIGARIKVVSESIFQIREIKSGSSFLSQNDPRAHFGLGGSDKVELVEIRWPSGIVETFEDLPANQLIIVKEGDGIVGRKTFSVGIERR